MVKVVQTIEEFKKEIEFDGLVLVKFFTTWCPPCQKFGKVLDEIEKSKKDDKKLKFVGVDRDIEKTQKLYKEYKLTNIPTFKFFKGGKEVGEIIERELSKKRILDDIKKYY